jgi:hypothetical protein
MNHLQKHLSASLIALAALLAAPMAASALDLSSFAILSGASGVAGTDNSVTLTGSTVTSTVNGDVGSNGFDAANRISVNLTDSTVNGTVFYTSNAAGMSTNLTILRSTYSSAIAGVPLAVITAFNTAYDALTPTTGECTTTNTFSALGGLTLAPGTYCTDEVAKTGTLTLKGPSTGIWIFKVFATAGAPTLPIPLTGALTGTDFFVVMANGGNACNVYWWVAQAATMTKNAASAATPGFFQGNILAGAAITMTGITASTPGSPASASFKGNALAKNAVTMTDIQTVTACAGTVIPPTPTPSCDKDNDGKGKDGKGKDCDGNDKDKDHHDKDHDKDHKDDSRHSFKDGGNPFEHDGNKDEHGDKK